MRLMKVLIPARLRGRKLAATDGACLTDENGLR